MEPQNPEQINTIFIDYINERGQLFTSYNASQTRDVTRFNILESRNYNIDEHGNKTQIVQFELDCNLLSKDGAQKVELRDIKGVFAIPYN